MAKSTIKIGTQVVFVANDYYHRKAIVTEIDGDDAILRIEYMWRCKTINNQRNDGQWVAVKPMVSRQYLTTLSPVE